MKLRFIIIAILTLSVLGIEGCNVVGDSAPEESANFVLDSLRLLPMEDEILLLDKPFANLRNTNQDLASNSSGNIGNTLNSQERSSSSIGSLSSGKQSRLTSKFASINPERKVIKRQGDSFSTSFRHVPESKQSNQSLSEIKAATKQSIENRNRTTVSAEKLLRGGKHDKYPYSNITKKNSSLIDSKVKRRSKLAKSFNRKLEGRDLSLSEIEAKSISRINEALKGDTHNTEHKADDVNTGILSNSNTGTNPKKRRYRFSSSGSIDDGLARERAEQRIYNEEVNGHQSKKKNSKNQKEKNLANGRNRNSRDKSLLMSFSYDEDAQNTPTTKSRRGNKSNYKSAYDEGVGSDEQLTQQEIQQEKELIRASRGGSSASQMFGRSVTIALTGVDSRLGETQRHADANHILRIWLDRGEIELFSIPRGTPVDAGFSSKSLNYLANLRSNKGRDAYLKKIAEISGVGKIDYWIELGFSQAMGVMELLGFKENAKTALRVIRSRKAFRSGDYQRCYNQSQFIRQMILRHFPTSTGVMGSLALRAALNTVETNLKYDVAKAIIAELESKGFPKSDKSVEIKVRPAYKPEIKHIDLSDVAAIDMMNRKLETKLTKDGWIGKGRKPAFVASAYENKLETMVSRAEKSVDRSPMVAINLLKRIYEQRSWIQVNDKFDREVYMQRICMTLIKAYENAGFMIDADAVRYFYDEQKAIRSQEVSER
jgi:anionic cell wall polymer biosynthesis LytR-Cps2A-Psr (LCP) family protein